MSAPGKATVTKAGYREYIQSKEWQAVRKRYWASKMPKECYGCGKPKHPGMHLHHRTYKNLGNERLMDLVPVCQPCHRDIHYLYDSDPKWKQRGLWYATKAIRNMNLKAQNPKTGKGKMQAAPRKQRRKAAKRAAQQIDNKT